MKKILYIAYGSNMNISQMAVRCPTAKAVGTAYLEEFELLFRGGNGGAVATVEPKNGGSVPVTVWELQPSDELSLNRYEGYPNFYRKEYVKVKFGGRLRKMMVYIMNDGRPLGVPSRYYYNTILQGYKSAGFEIEPLCDALRRSY